MSAPGISIHLVRLEDLDAVARLSHAMEQHYEGDAAPVEETIRPQVEAALFGPAPLAEALLAELDEVAVGVAFFSPFFPTHRHKSGLLLKDVFVVEEARSRGVGTALFREVARLALSRGYNRVDWLVRTTNEDARRLYRNLGAEELDRTAYRLREAGLAALAQADD